MRHVIVLTGMALIFLVASMGWSPWLSLLIGVAGAALIQLVDRRSEPCS